jgi:hypothetical protein
MAKLTANELIERAEAARFRITTSGANLCLTLSRYYNPGEVLDVVGIEALGRAILQEVPANGPSALGMKPNFSIRDTNYNLLESLSRAAGVKQTIGFGAETKPFLDRSGQIRIATLDLSFVEHGFFRELEVLLPEHWRRWVGAEQLFKSFDQKVGQEIDDDESVVDVTREIEATQERLSALQAERVARRAQLRQEKQGAAEDFVFVAGGREI